MIRFVEIKDLLNSVYFFNKDKDFVLSFLEGIGFKNAKSIVVVDMNLRGQYTSRRACGVRQFFETCIGHKIGEMFSLEVATKIAVEEYLYQVKELKDNSNSQKQIDSDKGMLYGFLVASFLTEASMGDILKAAKPEDAEIIRQILKRVLG